MLVNVALQLLKICVHWCKDKIDHGGYELESWIFTLNDVRSGLERPLLY